MKTTSPTTAGLCPHFASLRISETNGMSVVSGRRLTGFLAGLRRRIRVLCQPRSENCPGLPIFFGEAEAGDEPCRTTAVSADQIPSKQWFGGPQPNAHVVHLQ